MTSSDPNRQPASPPAEFTDDTEPDRLDYGLPPITAPALAVAAFVLLAVALTTDTGGRIAGVVAAVILILGAGWAARGPTLSADRAGVTVRGALRQRQLSWEDVVVVRADDRRRTRAVEFETRTDLVVVPASLLGRDTAGEVADAVSALRDRIRRAQPESAPER